MMTSAAANVAQSSSPRRRRARDYNIPVRLNGQPRAGSSSSTGASAASAAARAEVSSLSVQVTLTSVVAPQRRVATQLVANSSQSSVERIVRLLLVLIVITVSIKVQQIHCDSQSSHLPNQLPEAGAKLTTKHSKQAAETTGSGKGPPSARLQAAADGTKSKRHREKLLAMLSENIERQHLKMAASMGVASLRRPSKFDSGDDFAAGSQATQFLGAAATAQSKKSDDILRNIMMLHEQAPPPAASLMRLHLADNQQTDSADKLTTGASPMKLVPRLLSHIVSPLTLLGTRKLSSSSAVGNKLFANISLPLRPIHQAFTGRSNAGASRGSGAALAATSAPIIQSSFPTLPNWATKTTKTKSGTRLSTAKPSTMFGQHETGSDGSHWLMSFASAPAAATMSNQQSTSETIDGDLMAADSSQPTSSVPAMKPANRPPSSSSSSSSLSWRQNRGTSVSHYGDDEPAKEGDKGTKSRRMPPLVVGKWLSDGANQMAQNYLKDSFRGLFTLSQLPILPVGPVSTAPSVLEPKQPQRKRQNHDQQAQSSTLNAAATISQTTNDKKTGSDRRAKALEDLYRYAYILGTSMRRKRDPLKALSTNTRPHRPGRNFFSQRSIGQLAADNRQHIIRLAKSLQKALVGSSVGSPAKQQANPRGVMWDMATDPTLVVTLMHLIERASVALPLGFLLMPVVQMIRNPLNGINLGRVLPPRALHRSVEHELLAKRLDAVDKVLSRALRPSHRESFIGKRK